MPTKNTALTAGKYSKTVAYLQSDEHMEYALNCMHHVSQDTQPEPRPVNSQVVRGGVAGFYGRYGADWKQRNKSLGTDRVEVTGFDDLRPHLTGLDVGI